MNTFPSTGITASKALGDSSLKDEPELMPRRLPQQSSNALPEVSMFGEFSSKLSLPLSRRIIFPALYRSRSTPMEPSKGQEIEMQKTDADDLFRRRPSFMTESTKPERRQGQLDALLALSPLSSRTDVVSVADANIEIKEGKPSITRVRRYPIRPLPRPPLFSLLLPEVDENDDGEDDDSDLQPSSSSATPLSSLFPSPTRVKLQAANVESPRRTILMRKQPIISHPEEDPFKKPPKKTPKTPPISILRNTTKAESVKLTFSPNEGGGVPALVSVKDDDELSSQSSTDMMPPIAPGDPSSKHPLLNRVSSSCSTDNKGTNAGVKFDPRIWVREFQRSDEESEIWYTADDLERFKRHAVALIMARTNLESELIPTGTGRMVQKAPSQACKAFFTHAALRLDASDDDGREEEEMLKKEVRRIDTAKSELENVLIVDPHDICLTLFTKALKALLPHVNISTARTSEEALRHISSRGSKQYDLILVEHRLKLFHRQNIRSAATDEKGVLSASASSSEYHTGSELILALRQLDATRNTLFIGVSAHMDKDKPSLRKSGANFCWAKPPPRLDQELLNRLLKCVLEKRGKTELAKDLFDTFPC